MNKGIVCAILLGAAMMTCETVHAQEQTPQETTQAAAQTAQQTKAIQTQDGVLSILVPNEQWHVITDSNHWFVIGDGENMITIDHLANGETLPASAAVSGDKAALFQAFISTKNEVFVVTGSAAKQEKLDLLTKMIGTIKVLKYDTKTAVKQDTAKQDTAASSAASSSAGFTVNPINETYYSTIDGLNVRSGYSTDDSAIGSLSYGESVTVIGSVIQDGKDTGWYQISYNGSTAYASAQYLSKTKPAESSADDYFLVYGADRISVAIHPVGGGMYEDMDSRTYSDSGNGIYYCNTTGETFASDVNEWDYGALAGQGMDYSNVNTEGDPYDNVNTEGDPYGEINYDNVNIEGDPYGEINYDNVNIEGDPYGEINVEG